MELHRPQPTSEQPLHMQITCSAENCMLAMLRRMIDYVADEVGFNVEDRYKIEMAVDEACSNAFIHAYSGEQWTESTPEIEVRMTIEANGLTIQVKDQGQGLSNEDQERLFQAFEKLGAKPTGDERSTGLGLSIVKKIIESYSGTIGVESGPGKTVFEVQLPKQ